MILEIESVSGDVLLYGKRLCEAELRERVESLLGLVDEEEFPSAFCLRYGYETIEYDPNLKIDFVIDLDTHWVYKPKY